MKTPRKRLRRHKVLEVSATLSLAAVVVPSTPPAKGEQGTTPVSSSPSVATGSTPVHRARKNVPLSRQWHVKRKMYDFARRATSDPVVEEVKE